MIQFINIYLCKVHIYIEKSLKKLIYFKKNMKKIDSIRFLKSWQDYVFVNLTFLSSRRRLNWS